jgi:hypothetical protein
VYEASLASIADTVHAARGDRRKSKRNKGMTSASIHQGSPIDPPHIHDSCQTDPIDPDLALIVEAWPGLPDAVKAGMVAMAQAAARSPDVQHSPREV